MTCLIRDVLDFSRIIKGDANYEKVNLQEVLSKILEDFEVLIEQKKAIIKADELPVIEVIPLQIRQFFSNLISNALKFSKSDKTPEIEVLYHEVSGKEIDDTLKIERNKNYHKIIIKDNGIGIDPMHSEKIFNIFQRLHSKVEYEGTGIGLALCKKICINHEGTIIYKPNESTGGSVFEVLIPKKQIINN